MTLEEALNSYVLEIHPDSKLYGYTASALVKTALLLEENHVSPEELDDFMKGYQLGFSDGQKITEVALDKFLIGEFGVSFKPKVGDEDGTV